MTADRDDLAAILAKHTRNDGPQYIACICGWTHIGGYPTGARPHTQHLASMVLESDWLRGVKADVWDKGVRQQWAAKERVRFNPYRADNTTDRTHKTEP